MTFYHFGINHKLMSRQMTSLQILAQNLLYDISQIAIPWDRVDTEYLQQPRRWSSSGELTIPTTRPMFKWA
jgi:hypothetical protein